MIAEYLKWVNIVVAALMVVLMTTYMSRYYWWKRPEGRIVVGGLTSALSVLVGGLFERFGYMIPHNVFAALGYTGAALVLILATRHVIQVQNGHAVQAWPRDFR